MMKSSKTDVYIDIYGDQKLTGDRVIDACKYLHQLKGVFKDMNAYSKLDSQTLIYEVQVYKPVNDGTEGGLFFGNSKIHPGKVGKEFFMTRGHFHEKKDTAEYYWCLKGNGALIFMDTNRNCWLEWMETGSLHYIKGNVAHRVANIGDDILFFNACWHSNAGHDYESIDKNGFSARLIEIDGYPKLVKE